MSVVPKKKRRRAHVIAPRKTVRLTRSFLFFDVETKPVDDKGTQKMTLAYACHWLLDNKTGGEKTDWFSTTKQKDLYNYIVSKCHRHIKLRLMSANIWFDLRTSTLFNRFLDAGWRCKSLYTRGKVFIVTLTKGKLVIECINIQNYFHFPVDMIGASIGLPKIKIDLDRASEADLRVYCKRDVEIIYKAFKSLYYFVRDNNLGDVSRTVASISMSVFQHSFLKGGIGVHGQDDVLALERKAYYGGRTECFRIGKFAAGKYYKLDVNSMYPYVMAINDYPVKYDKTGYNVKPEIIKQFTFKWLYVAEVELETDKPVYPYRMNERVVFPTGHFTTCLTTPSILYAIEQGHCVSLLKVAAYRRRNIFKEFVEYFYNKRLEFRNQDNPAFAMICKSILNNLYGKFGQTASVIEEENEVDTKEVFRELIINYHTNETIIHQIFLGLEQYILQKQGEASQSVPAIPAHVTDYARLYLWKLMVKAGRRNVFYCDTDSLIVNERGFKRLVNLMATDLIGMLKVEDIADTMEIRGAKDYTFGRKVVIKGVGSKAKKLKDGSYEKPHFPTFIAEMRKGLKEDYRIETVTKKLSRRYTKGVVLPSGRVRPFSLPRDLQGQA